MDHRKTLEKLFERVEEMHREELSARGRSRRQPERGVHPGGAGRSFLKSRGRKGDFVVRFLKIELFHPPSNLFSMGRG